MNLPIRKKQVMFLLCVQALSVVNKIKAIRTYYYIINLYSINVPNAIHTDYRRNLAQPWPMAIGPKMHKPNNSKMINIQIKL